MAVEVLEIEGLGVVGLDAINNLTRIVFIKRLSNNREPFLCLES